MSPQPLLETTLGWVERGYIPDCTVRAAIRQLCAQRRRKEMVGSCEQRLIRQLTFITEMDTGPIAPLPHKANEQHYELPAEFFAHILGTHRKYSCCLWSEGETRLDRAEEAALAATCQHAGIADGQQILELGCGWGALTLWMAEHYPGSRITAVSNSAAQGASIEQRAAARGLANIEVQTADMNDFTTARAFDRVVSVEMFEHMRNWRLLLHHIAGWLRPGGLLLVHTFCHRDCVYPFAERDTSDWMARHFFTGGIMPSDGLMHHFQDDLRWRNQWRWNGRHYAATANAWLTHLDRHRKAILPLLEAVHGRDAALWHQRWRMFMMAVAELFGFRGGEEWWVVHHLLEKPADG